MATNFDRYRLQYQPEWKMDCQIGSGGFGIVYKEQMRRPGMFRSELCAVKKIPLGIVDVAGDLRRYKREIAILASLVHHEWFVQIFGWHETKDSVFLAMEYMELGDLGGHIAAPWSEDDTKIVAAQVLNGLSVLHEAGIAHRDLKPQNIFPILLDDGCLRIKIGDFGVSKSVAPSTHTNLRTLIRVVGYTAPEMVGQSGSYTNAVDLWSLGCLVYRMICGEDLFPSFEDLYRYKFNILPYPKQSLRDRGISDGGVEFMERLLQDNPQHRPSAVNALSSSWICPETLGYSISSSQVERFRNQVQPPANLILDNAETIRPLLPAQLGPDTSVLPHSLSSHRTASDPIIDIGLSTERKRPSNPSIYDVGKLWDPSAWKCQSTLLGHSYSVNSVAFSPDGKLLASGSSDATVKLWDPSKGKCQATLSGHSRCIRSVTFSPDGKCLASGSDDRTVRIWDPLTGACQANLIGHSDHVNSVAFSPDSKRLATASGDRTIKLWDPSTGKRKASLKGHAHIVKSAVFSPDGRRLASGSFDASVKLWDLAKGVCEATLRNDLVLTRRGYELTLKNDHDVYSVVFSPDGKYVASGHRNNTISLWDLRTGTCQASLEGHCHRVNLVVFSPDGGCLASASTDQTIRLWDPFKGSCYSTLKEHSAWVNSVAFSPDSKRLASASKDKTINLWGPRNSHDKGP